MNWISRNNNFKSRSMSEISLRRLWMIKSTMTNSTPCSSKCKTCTIKLSSWSKSILSSLIDNLIESRENIITELYLSNCSMSYNSKSNSKTCNALFWKWCVKYSIYSILFEKSTSTTENTSKFNILTEYFCTTIDYNLRMICG